MLEGSRDPEVELRLAGGRETVGDRAADELVREAEGEPAPRLLHQQAAADRLVDRVEQRRLGDVGRPPHGVELELRARDGRQLEQPVRVSPESRASRWLTTSRTVVGVPSSAAGRASRALRGPTTIAPDSISSRQSSLRRNAFPPVSSPIVARRSTAASTPVVRRTNSAISSSESPPSRTRTTPSER